MKFTLLDMTQNILSRMSSDEVNSIGDTPESLQVANIIKNKYFDIISRVNIPDHDQLVQLNPSLTLTQPTMMFVPNGITNIKWLKYFNSNGTPDPGYEYVNILPITQFIEIINGFNPSETDVESFTFSDTSNSYPSDYTFYYKNAQQPRFCTILSNFYVIFDAYDSSQDDTLQDSKTMALGRVVPLFEMVDAFIPNLPDEQFQLLINEATSLAFYELKQQSHALALQEAKRGWTSVQKTKAVVNKPTDFDALQNFGRNGRGFRSATSLFKDRGWDI